MPISAIRKLYPYAQRAMKRGIFVHYLNIGQPDLPTPTLYFRQIQQLAKKSVVYAPSAGTSDAIEAWRQYYRSYGIQYNQDEIIITTGGSEAIFFAMLAVADSGDEILTFEPLYTNYLSYARMAGISLKAILLYAKDNFEIPITQQILKKITSKTRAIIICNPSNPTGTVFSKAELKRITEVAKKKNLFIITDEVYRELVYNGRQFISMMEFSEVRDRIIMVDSISKRFNLCGARVGCIASKNKQVMQCVLRFAQGRLSAPMLEQLAVIPLLKNPQRHTKTLVAEYERRRAVVMEAFRGVSGMYCSKPVGAFYVLVTLPVNNAEHFSKWLLEKFSYKKETVMLAPGNGFYITPGLGKKQVRIAYIESVPKLKRAMEIIKRALQKYNARYK